MTSPLALLRALLAAVDALCASRRTHAMLALVVLLLLATGDGARAGGAAAACGGGAAVATAVERTAASGEPGRSLPLLRLAVAERRSVPVPRALPRWRDLREGGLPPPRAPDAVA